MDRFDRVDAVHGTALVRLSGRRRGEVRPGTLVVLAGETVHRFPAVPEPAPASGWRMAFGVPTDVLDRARAFALDLDEGVVPIAAPARVSPSVPEPEPGDEPESGGIDTRRLVALELILNGCHRDDVEAHLKGQFGPDAARAIAADVYGER